MRRFGVEEEFLLVRSDDLTPLPMAEDVVQRSQSGHPGSKPLMPVEDGPGRSLLAAELHKEQLEVVGPPVRTFQEQLAAIRQGRSEADAAARACGGRVVALGSSVLPVQPHLTTDLRHRRMGRHFGLLARHQLTCGFHVHVEVETREEGLGVLDHIRIWLPVLLALSTNSPYWHGGDSGFASYRYQSWSSWPTAGPTELYGSVAEYERRAAAAIGSGAALDAGMLYWDARLSARYPTIEIRVMDVCMKAEHAAALATLARALVEMAARQVSAGIASPEVKSDELRAWSFRAARFGLSEELIAPLEGCPAAAWSVVEQLLALVSPVLAEYGEARDVGIVVQDILAAGTGAEFQRSAYRDRRNLRDVVESALRLTHLDGPPDEPVTAPRVGASA